MRKFFSEFKKFITRGNVLDMAVGVIVGGAFTAIVNSMSNNILKPLINWLLSVILGKDSLNELYTYLPEPVYAEDGTIDLVNSIYIDWGAFINAIINFLITAFVLFLIVRTINRFKERHEDMKDTFQEHTLDRAERKELKAAGVKLRDKAAVKAYFEEKDRLAAEAAAKAAADAEAAAQADRLANPTTEDLLKKIIVLLENK